MSEQSVTPRRDGARHSTESRARFVYWFIALAMLLAVCFLHFWKLGTAPRGFYMDEASVAYNAYCIANTGADEYGVRHPVFFRCFDNYQDPVMIYFLAPLVKTLGLTQCVARFPSALFQILASVAFGFLVHEYCRNKWLSLSGAVIFALMPWAFLVSRSVSSGYTAMLFGMNLGWVCSLIALRKKSHLYAALAGIGWAFAMYAHNVGRPGTAVWLIGFGLVLNDLLIKRWRIWLSFSFSFVLCLLPMIISVLHSPESLTTRFQSIGMFHEHASLGDALYRFAVRYIEYFSLRFLWVTGDTNLRHHTGFGGELFVFTVPLILVGLFYVGRFFRKQPSYRLLAVALVAYPLAASLTVDRMHGTRSINGVIPWLLLAMVGAQALWRHRPIGRKLLVVICVAGLVESGMYMADYFGPYQTRCQVAFMTGFTDAFKYCFSHISNNQTLYVSGSVGVASEGFIDTNFKEFVYAYLLFYGRTDPWTYQHGGFSNTIVRPYLEEIDQPGLLLRCNYMPANTLSSEGPRISFIPNHESIPDTAKLLVTFQDDLFVWQVWEVRTTPQGGVTHNNPRPALKHGGTFRYPDAEAHNNLGAALAQTGKIEEAIAHFEQALRINPDFADAHANLGNALWQVGRIPEAIEHFEQVVRIEPDLAEAHNNLGAALAQTGKIEEAIAHFEQALRVNPDFANAHYSLGLALARLGRMPDAVGHWEQALRINPDYAEAHYSMGIVLEQAGRVTEARGHYEQALRIKPDYAEAHENLGNILLQEGKISDAIGHYEQALRSKPDSAEAHYNWGLALARLGRLPDAVGHWEQALRIKPDYAEVHCALGMASEQTGKVREAIGHYEQALRIKPDFAQAQNALARLQGSQ